MMAEGVKGHVFLLGWLLLLLAACAGGPAPEKADSRTAALVGGPWGIYPPAGVRFLDKQTYIRRAKEIIRSRYPGEILEAYEIRGPFWRDEMNPSASRKRHVKVEFVKTVRQGFKHNVCRKLEVVLDSNARPLVFCRSQRRVRRDIRPPALPAEKKPLRITL